MPTSTTKFKFYKYNTATDGDLKFNFNTSLNDNWDRIETNVAITIYNNTTTYKKDDCVLSPTNFRVYYSLINNNTGNSLLDTTKWIPVDTTSPGMIRYFAGSTTPSGYLICDGSAVSRTTYSELYSVIGTTYGTGNGSTTFNLPNLIDKFPQGSTTVGTVKSAGLPNITGEIMGGSGYGTCTGCFASSYGAGDYGNVGDGIGAWRINMNAANSSSIYSNDVTTVQPPALTLLPCIRY